MLRPKSVVVLGVRRHDLHPVIVPGSQRPLISAGYSLIGGLVCRLSVVAAHHLIRTDDRLWGGRAAWTEDRPLGEWRHSVYFVHSSSMHCL